MKVLMLLEGEFPYDERVEKEALTLVAAGYEVEIFAFSLKGKSHTENYKGIKVYSLRLPKLIYKFYPALLVAPVYEWCRAKQLRKAVGETRYDFIHVHDLPMARFGWRLKKKWNAKLICDQHEFYSNWIGRTAHMQTLAGRMIGLFSRWKKYEKKYLNRADLVITVSDNLRDIYIELHGIAEEKIISVPNTPMKKDLEVKPADLDLKERYKDKFVLFYGGMIDILRGIDNMVRAIPIIRERIPNIQLVLAGRMRRGCDPMATARSLGVERYVDYVGFLSQPELRAYMEASSICFAASPADSIEVNNAISTKIYQYISARKPIMVGSAKMMKDLILKYNLGMSTQETDPLKIAETIIKMSEEIHSFTFEVPETIMFWDYTSLVLTERYNKLS